MATTIKINPKELLFRLASSKSSGCLELDEGLVYWKIYLEQGSIKYVYCSAQLLDQLKYHLYYLGWKQALAALKSPSYAAIRSHIPETSSNQNLYSKVITWLLTEKHLDSFQSSKLIEHMTKDALESCLWLNRGTLSWYNREPIPFWIQELVGHCPSLSVSECLNVEQTRLTKWQKCSEQLLSVHQRPYFAAGWETKPLPLYGSLNHQTLNKLGKMIRGRTSIRQLSLLLQKDELNVARILSPYIDYQIIYLRNAQPPLDLLPNIPRSPTNIQRKKTIVCIDDSPTILQEIQRFLDQKKFKVTAINDPVQAVSVIFKINPDLILLDITMPRINGYKLCSLLRGSDNCNQTPIIMVTGNTGLIDKARAKIAGATDYFTKPFSQQQLMQVIEKYLN
ncbi:MAG: response regulator [Pleurocapsa sp. MO_192.B19]|nr:response regulator [Pleurocapsa sp. MO_192.B19]